MTTSAPDCMMLAVEVGVLRALELAGKRARNTGRRSLEAMPGVAAWEVHTRRRLATSPDDCDRLLRDVWELLSAVLDQPRIIAAADWYTRQLIVTQQPHRAADLRRVLAVACEPV
jgi:hypothetical protein